jgi:hypothetical protein
MITPVVLNSKGRLRLRLAKRFFLLVLGRMLSPAGSKLKGSCRFEAQGAVIGRLVAKKNTFHPGSLIQLLFGTLFRESLYF